MAGEITLAGQIVVYGGANLTLLGSTIGNAVTSILAREGTGSARGWKLFDPTKVDFLNTKKTLVDGDIVLVNAKVLPMDFPVKVAAAATSIPPDTQQFSLAANAGSLVSDYPVDSMGFRATLSGGTFPDGTTTLTVSVNGGALGTIAQANTAITALADATITASGYTLQYRITRVALTAASTTLTLTYA